jgi:hypothetical protein
MSLSFPQVQEHVHKKIGTERTQTIINFIKGYEPKLWGTQNGVRQYVDMMIYLAIYKDIFGVGYSALSHQVQFVRVWDKTLKHNVQLLRKLLMKWGKTKIALGDKTAWEYAMRKRKPGRKIQDCNLLIDSADFRLTGSNSASPKNSGWSAKLGKPAQRYMILYDGRGEIRKVWGGYSPKVYDSDFIKIQKQFLDDELPGAVVLGDNHFAKANEYLDNCPFYCTVAEKSRKRDSSGKRVATLTKEQREWNRQVSDLRSSVEHPFGNIKKKFAALQCFAEGEKQQDYLVTFAFGVINDKKQ